jgi:hypothetical protein
VKTLKRVAAVVMLSSLAFAQEGPPGGRGPPRRPPPEALAACEGKSAGASCSFSHESHSVSGTCFAPEGKPLACKPDRPPPGGEGPQ